MRWNPIFASLALGPLCVAVAVGACGDSEATPAPSPEAGVQDSVAPPPVTEGGTSDAATDAGASGITVSVVAQTGAAVAGVPVVFHDSAGAVVEVIATDAQGRARRDALGVSMVTVAHELPPSLDPSFHTWIGVADGDVLNFVSSSSTPTGFYDVTLPGGFAGAAEHTVGVGGRCVSQNLGPTPVGSTQLRVRGRCHRAKPTLLATATDATGLPLGFSSLKNQVAPDGGTVAVTMPAWTASTPITVDVQNPPTSGTRYAFLSQIVSDANFRQRQTFLPDGGLSFAAASGFPEALQVVVVQGLLGILDPTRVVGKRTLPVPRMTIDFGEALAELTDVTMDVSDRIRPEVRWTSAQPLVAADGGGVAFMWSSLNAGGMWTFTVPATATSVKTPALPPSLAPLGPQRGDSFVNGVTVAFVESDTIPDYAAFRSSMASVIDENGDVRWLLAPQTGSIRTTAYIGTPP